MEIKLNIVGKIVDGCDLGSYVKIIDDEENAGGFLILTAISPDMEKGHDNWVKDYSGLKQYFEESGWVVDWA